MFVDVPEPVWKISNDKMLIEFARDHLLCRLNQSPLQVFGPASQFRICYPGVLLDQAKRANELAREAQIADRKILNCASRLRAVITPWRARASRPSKSVSILKDSAMKHPFIEWHSEWQSAIRGFALTRAAQALIPSGRSTVPNA